MRGSYSAALLVHSNSKRKAINVLFPYGYLRMQPTPTTSFDLEASKYKVQKLVMLSVLVSLDSIILQSASIV